MEAGSVTPAARMRRWLWHVIAVAALLAAMTAAAVADDGPVNLMDPGENQVQDGTKLDTTVTPVAKEQSPTGDQWEWWGGLHWRSDQNANTADEPESKTPITVNFFTVRFRNTEDGYAGGAACADTSATYSQLATCPRVPVIWHYAKDPTQADGEWTEIYRGTDPGYVGAIAFGGSDGTKVIAVGGTGKYPRTEPNRPDGDAMDAKGDADYAQHDLTDGAGRARVWLLDTDRYGDSSAPQFHELPQDELSPSLPSDLPMAGLTAIDCSPRTSGSDAGDCWAGGLQQIWHWKGGAFVDGFGPRMKTDQDLHAENFHYRVRDIRVNGGASAAQSPQVVAMTSGCCGASLTDDQGTVLILDGRVGHWEVRPLSFKNAAQNVRTGGRSPRDTIPDSYWSFMLSGPRDAGEKDKGPWASVVVSAGRAFAGDPTTDAVNSPPSRIIGGIPMDGSDTAASAPTRGFGNTPLTPGYTGPAAGLGGGTESDSLTGNVVSYLAEPELSSLRLTAGDGDFAGMGSIEDQAGYLPGTASYGPDHLIDWGVGELRSTDQGVAYTTLASGRAVADTVVCPSSPLGGLNTNGAQILLSCKAGDPTNAKGDLQSARLIKLPVYGLNGFQYVPDSGEAWAVGDDGALLSLGHNSSGSGSAAEPDAPVLGGATPAKLPDTSAYDPFRPLGWTATSGLVPPLALRPVSHLSEPRLIPAGTPETGDGGAHGFDRVSSIAMSRDGQEGWAIGHVAHNSEWLAANLTLFHYDGLSWTRCDPDGVKHQLAADPACAGLAPLESYVSGTTPKPVGLSVIARVPFENDDDSSNDDDFEAMAIGGQYKPPGATAETPVVAVYRNGAWQVDTAAMQDLSKALPAQGVVGQLVLSRPGEGWAVATAGDGSEIFNFLLRLHDGHWISCAVPDVPACDDGNKLLGANRNAGGRLLDGDTFLAQAGDRTYVASTRPGNGTGNGTADGVVNNAGSRIAYVLHLDPARDADADKADGTWAADSTGLSDRKAPLDKVTGLAVAKGPDGSYNGWVTGDFNGTGVLVNPRNAGDTNNPGVASTDVAGDQLASGETPVLKVTNAGAAPVTPAGAAADALLHRRNTTGGKDAVLMTGMPGASAVIAPNALDDYRKSDGMAGPLLAFGAQGWAALPAPFSSLYDNPEALRASVNAVAPDNDGGMWAAVHKSLADKSSGTYFFHYTDEARQPVFSEMDHPFRDPANDRITAAAGGSDGSFWVATPGTLYRYDRLTGWAKLRLNGWDSGRLVTNPTAISAIAVGPDGRGLAVGPQGRIADLSPTGGVLDAIAGKGSAGGGTAHDLRAAAVAANGAALVGGAGRALLFRDGPDGQFKRIQSPAIAPTAAITGIAFPNGDLAWLTTSTGQVFVGPPSGTGWVREAIDDHRQDLSLDLNGFATPLRAVAIAPDGHGFAVGDRGVIIARGTDGSWTRLRSPVDVDLTSVALPADGKSPGALVGGNGGLILTYVDGRFAVARPADFSDPLTGEYNDEDNLSAIVGMALVPGRVDGQVEAFAASYPRRAQERTGTPAILHYTSDPGDPVMDPDARVKPLPDSPEHEDGELSFAAFGKTDCDNNNPCQEMQGANLTNDIFARRIADAVTTAAEGKGGPQFALFTGDINQAAGKNRYNVSTPLEQNVMQERWNQLFADRITRSGLPLFGAVGGQDMSQAKECSTRAVGAPCEGTHQAASIGTTDIWQATMARYPAPWGDGNPAAFDGLQFIPVDPQPKDGKAQTHYAFDVKSGDKALARVVVVDTSTRSLTVSDATQNPVEDQLTWLDDTLKSRGEGVPAIVVSEDPTYSYGAGALTDTQSTDATQMETILMRNHVNAVISGRLGFNGLYWATAPGVHFPCAGGSYPDQYTQTPEAGAAPNCTSAAGSSAPDPSNAATLVAAGLRSLDAPAVPDVAGVTDSQGVTGALPFVIAASAGGPFGPDGRASGSANDGYWRGYTVVRLLPTGRVVVEQRPIFDWLGLQAISHVLKPGQRMQLNGFGREPVAFDTPVRYDDINTPAITHRYDLVEADPDQPYLPKVVEGNGNPHGYVPLDPGVGQVDPQTGKVTTGRGNHGRIYALAVLSAGDKAASWPIVFEPRKSYKQPTRREISVPPVLPPIRVLGLAAQSVPSQAPPSAPQTPPISADLTFPAPPALPGLPGVSTPAVVPPAPPAPPPPPAQHAPVGLDITATPVGLTVPPPSSPIPPPAPPINPAPPGGARKEARQRQAATAKSEEGGGEAGEAHGRIDAVDSPNASSTSLRPQRGEPHAFTAMSHRAQPSAWVTGLEWGGGSALMAIVLALGFVTVRPTPRRRKPEVPAPAWVRSNSGRRDT